MSDDLSAEHLAQVVIRGLAAGQAVEIDGLGVFYPDPGRGFRFEPSTLAQVFVAYAREDLAVAERLHGDLAMAGFSPWMDGARLLPGQNWPRAIESAIESSGFFIACFSENSVNKHGGFQVELGYALDCARRVPLDEIFIVPVPSGRLPRAALNPTGTALYRPVSRLAAGNPSGDGHVASRGGPAPKVARRRAPQGESNYDFLRTAVTSGPSAGWRWRWWRTHWRVRSYC